MSTNGMPDDGSPEFSFDDRPDSRPSWYKRLTHWRGLWRGLRARAAGCTWCGSSFIRPSQKPPDALMKLLRLRRYRCRSCFARFALPEARTR